MLIEKNFILGTEFESNTYYRGDKKEYHIYPCNTVKAEKRKYFSVHKNSDIDSMDVFAFIKDKKNITLDFCGADLIFHGRIQPFLIENSENITIKNCSVKYDRPFYTEFEIVEVGDGYIKVKSDKNSTYRVEDGKLIITSEFWENNNLDKTEMWFQAFDADTGEGKGLAIAMIGREIFKNPDYPFELGQYIPSQCGELLRLDGPIHSSWTVGTILCLAHETREFSGVFMFDSNNCRIENYRLINGAGMGICPIHTSNIYINGLKLMYDSASSGIIANAADAIHAVGCGGDFEIIDSTIEGMIDDALNIHSNFYLFDSGEGNTVYMKNLTWMGIHSEIFGIGDKIGIYNGRTMERTGEYIIEEFEIIDDDTMKLILNKPVGAHKEGDLIENLSMQPDVTIRNSKFGKANSHIRMQSRGKIIIEDSEIGLPVWLTGDASCWFESSPICDITFRNVDFCTDKAKISITPEIFPTEKEPYYHKNIKVQNCRFVTDLPVEGGYADNIEFIGNVNVSGKKMKMILTNCGAVNAENCELIRKTEVKTELKIN